MKECFRCKKAKNLEQFHKNGKRGVHSWCRDCVNEYARKNRIKRSNSEQKRSWLLSSRYGITQKSFLAILEKQKGKCAICEVTPIRPCVDHDHSTGKIRGILCHRCNVQIAILDNEDMKMHATTYLNRTTAYGHVRVKPMSEIAKWIGGRIMDYEAGKL